MELELGNIATDEKHKLTGFKILGLFSFFLNYIRVDTQIQLSAIQNEIEQITDKEASIDDFNNHEIQSKFVPLFKKYCITGLINRRDNKLGRIKKWFFDKFITSKIESKIDECGYKQLFSLYSMIRNLNEPAFFLACWKDLKRKDHTILSGEKPS